MRRLCGEQWPSSTSLGLWAHEKHAAVPLEGHRPGEVGDGGGQMPEFQARTCCSQPGSPQGPTRMTRVEASLDRQGREPGDSDSAEEDPSKGDDSRPAPGPGSRNTGHRPGCREVTVPGSVWGGRGPTFPQRCCRGCAWGRQGLPDSAKCSSQGFGSAAPHAQALLFSLRFNLLMHLFVYLRERQRGCTSGGGAQRDCPADWARCGTGSRRPESRTRAETLNLPCAPRRPRTGGRDNRVAALSWVGLRQRVGTSSDPDRREPRPESADAALSAGP